MEDFFNLILEPLKELFKELEFRLLYIGLFQLIANGY